MAASLRLGMRGAAGSALGAARPSARSLLARSRPLGWAGSPRGAAKVSERALARAIKADEWFTDPEIEDGPSMEEIVEHTKEFKWQLEKDKIERLKNYDPERSAKVSPEDPLGFIEDKEAYVRSTAPDISDDSDTPASLIGSGIECTIDSYGYPPYFGDPYLELKEQPNKSKVVMTLDVGQLNFTETQMHRFKQIVSQRYSPSKNELKLVSREPKQRDSYRRVKEMLATLLEEVRKVD